MIEKIKKEVKKTMMGINSCHEWEHVERVCNLALRIGKIEKADLEILTLASLLHDIARKEEDDSNGKIDHAKKGTILAKEILKKHGFKVETIKNVCHCIETHRFKKDQKTLEAKILYDADKLDSLGAIGVGRIFSFSGSIGAKVHNKGVRVEKIKKYSEDDTAYFIYETKLKHLKMFTLEGKRMAKDRLSFMKEFFKRLDKEA